MFQEAGRGSCPRSGLGNFWCALFIRSIPPPLDAAGGDLDTPMGSMQRIYCHLNLPQGVSLSISQAPQPHISLPSFTCFSFPCVSLTSEYSATSRLSSASRPLRVASRVGLLRCLSPSPVQPPLSHCCPWWGQSEPGSVLKLGWETPLSCQVVVMPQLSQAKDLQDLGAYTAALSLSTPALSLPLRPHLLSPGRP